MNNKEFNKLGVYRPKSSCNVSSLLDGHIIGATGLELAVNNHFAVETACSVSLAVASHIASTSFCTCYRDGTRVPIALSMIAEQPPSSSKSSVMEKLQAGMLEEIEALNAERKSKRNEIKRAINSRPADDREPNEQEEKELAKYCHIPEPFTEATPEALDASLEASCGWFSAMSTEQGLINTLMGGMYSEGKTNFDVLLRGWCAERGRGLRVTRQAFAGTPHGGFIIISQPGIIESIIEKASNTGLAQRPLFIEEGNMFGHQNFNLYVQPVCLNTFHEHSKKVVRQMAGNRSMHIKDLTCLTFDEESHRIITAQRQHFGDMMGDGGEYGDDFFQALFGKLATQIMKVAATLHIYNYAASHESISTVITADTTSTAAAICIEYLKGVRRIAERKELSGDRVEDDALISYIQKSVTGRDLRQINNSLKTTKPFKSIGDSDKRKLAIKRTLERIIENGEVEERLINRSGKTITRYFYSS